jgi:dihydroflavonol-4-reductase
VGGHLLTALVAAGTRVRALVRSETSAARVATAGATPHLVDLFDADGLRDALWGVDVLYHVAGVNETCPSNPARMDRVNVDGTRSVVAAAADAGVGRVVYTSSAAAIGEAEGMIGTERTVHSGVHLSAYARSKHRAELAAFAEAEAVGVDLVAVNPSSVQGPGRSGGSTRLLLHVLRSKRPLLVDTRLSIVDIEDCTAGHLAAAARGRGGERYLLSGATLSVTEAIRIIESTTGRAIHPRWVGEGTARTIGRPLARLAHAVRPRSGICPELIDTLLHGHRFDGSRAERELGIVYTPIDVTFARTIEWFEAEGLLSAS